MFVVKNSTGGIDLSKLYDLLGAVVALIDVVFCLDEGPPHVHYDFARIFSTINARAGSGFDRVMHLHA